MQPFHSPIPSEASANATAPRNATGAAVRQESEKTRAEGVPWRGPPGKTETVRPLSEQAFLQTLETLGRKPGTARVTRAAVGMESAEKSAKRDSEPDTLKTGKREAEGDDLHRDAPSASTTPVVRPFDSGEDMQPWLDSSAAAETPFDGPRPSSALLTSGRDAFRGVLDVRPEIVANQDPRADGASAEQPNGDVSTIRPDADAQAAVGEYDPEGLPAIPLADTRRASRLNAASALFEARRSATQAPDAGSEGTLARQKQDFPTNPSPSVGRVSAVSVKQEISSATPAFPNRTSIVTPAGSANDVTVPRFVDGISAWPFTSSDTAVEEGPAQRQTTAVSATSGTAGPGPASTQAGSSRASLQMTTSHPSGDQIANPEELAQNPGPEDGASQPSTATTHGASAAPKPNLSRTAAVLIGDGSRASNVEDSPPTVTPEEGEFDTAQPTTSDVRPITSQRAETFSAVDLRQIGRMSAASGSTPPDRIVQTPQGDVSQRTIEPENASLAGTTSRSAANTYHSAAIPAAIAVQGISAQSKQSKVDPNGDPSGRSFRDDRTVFAEVSVSRRVAPPITPPINPHAISVPSSIATPQTYPRSATEALDLSLEAVEPSASGGTVASTTSSGPVTGAVIAPSAGQAALATAQAIAAQLAAAAARLTGSETEVALSPEELGRVRMRMTGGDGVLHVSVLVERAETLDLMRRHLAELTQEFADEGYADVSFSFEQASEDGADAASDEGTGSTTFGRRYEPDGGLSEVSARTRPALVRTAAGGLDLRL